MADEDFITAENTLTWLSQFGVDDQRTAEQMLQAMLLVTRDEFLDRLRQMVLDRAADGDGPIGLYAEREVQPPRGEPEHLFEEETTRVRRAVGGSPQPVFSAAQNNPQVGSEGLVANLITELCRQFPDVFESHPGPDNIRSRRIRRFMLLTDLIGSGTRARRYLQAAWRVRSVRSWWSSKHLRFEVVAYAVTPQGRSLVEAHPSKPRISVVAGCPTVDTLLPVELRKRVHRLCSDYAPKKRDAVGPLGFKGTGALIAFAHGAPNNTPRLLHKGSSRWMALFPKRVTADTRSTFGDRRDASAFAERLVAIRQNRLASGAWLQNATTEGRALFLVLAALGRGPRFNEVLSRKTGLTVLEVRQSVERAEALRWIDANRRLTDSGQAELKYARRRNDPVPPIPLEPENPYYPSSLRAPHETSS